MMMRERICDIQCLFEISFTRSFKTIGEDPTTAGQTEQRDLACTITKEGGSKRA